MSTFSLDLAKFAEKVKGRADAVTGDVVAQVAQALDLRSPVGDASYWQHPAPKGYVGGRFRGNWQLGVDFIPAGETGRVDPAGDATFSMILGAIPAESAGHLYTLTNNVPYAEEIERGHSKRQAPQGLVGLTAIEFPQMVDQAVAGLPQ